MDTARISVPWFRGLMVALLFACARAIWSQEAKPLVISGELSAKDPLDKVRKQGHHKVHELELKAGEIYVIDLRSVDFDTFLRLEDGAGKKISENDDISENDLNSRLGFVPKKTGTYRAVVTSYWAGRTGKYTLQAGGLKKVGEPKVIEGKLTEKSAVANGRHYQQHKIEFKAGEFWLIDLMSKDFDPVLYVHDRKKQLIAFDDDGGEGLNSRLVLGVGDGGEYLLGTQAFEVGTKGEYTLRLQRCERIAAVDLTQEERWQQEARRLNQQGLDLHGAGRYTEATEPVKQALALREKLYPKSKYPQGHADLAISLNNLGAIYDMQGDHAKAEPLLKQALEIYRQVLGEKHPLFAKNLNNLALVYHHQGDYAKAEPLYKQALGIYRQVLGEKHPDFADSLIGLASIYNAQGDYAKAEPLYKQALEIYRQVLGEKHPDFATNLNNLALVYQNQRAYAKAELLYKQALDIRRQVQGEKHPNFAASLNNLGALYQDQGDYAKAEPLYKQALGICQQVLGEKHPNFAASLNNLASIYNAQGDYAKAESFSRQSVLITREHLENSSLVQSERQQFAHRKSVESYVSNFLRVTAKIETKTVATYDVLLSWKGSVTARQRLTRLARTSLASDPAATQLFEELDNVSRQIATWTSKQPDQLPKGIDLAKKLADLTNHREEVEAKLSARAEAFRRFRQSQKLTTAELQKHLAEGTVLIDFVVYADKLAAFIVTRNQVQRVELGQTKPIAEAVDRFRATMKRTTPLLGKDDPARVLREKLLDPLDKYLAGATLLLIAPDGPLNGLPFAALPGKKEGKYLIEEVAIAIIPVPQMLPELLAKRDPARDKMPPSLLAIGDVDFDGALLLAKDLTTDAGTFKRKREGSPMKWDRLPGTRGEVLAIEDTFRKAVPQGKLTILREGQPTEATVRRLAPQHEFLHFATHGFFAPKSSLQPRKKERGFENGMRPKTVGHHPGLLSGIVLAGANKPKDDDDGVLTALEVSELDLTRVELAVLSACETGLGEVAGGEGVLGLQRAFQTAGARTTVTSLWKVNDLATSKLMERFYDNYLKKNMGTLEALREAQLWMLRDGVERGLTLIDDKLPRDARTPPYYWAAFVLSGDWR